MYLSHLFKLVVSEIYFVLPIDLLDGPFFSQPNFGIMGRNEYKYVQTQVCLIECTDSPDIPILRSVTSAMFPSRFDSIYDSEAKVSAPGIKARL